MKMADIDQSRKINKMMDRILEILIQETSDPEVQDVEVYQVLSLLLKITRKNSILPESIFDQLDRHMKKYNYSEFEKR